MACACKFLCSKKGMLDGSASMTPNDVQFIIRKDRLRKMNVRGLGKWLYVEKKCLRISFPAKQAWSLVSKFPLFNWGCVVWQLTFWQENCIHRKNTVIFHSSNSPKNYTLGYDSSPYHDVLSSSDNSDKKYSRLTPSVAGNLESWWLFFSAALDLLRLWCPSFFLLLRRVVQRRHLGKISVES